MPKEFGGREVLSPEQQQKWPTDRDVFDWVCNSSPPDGMDRFVIPNITIYRDLNTLEPEPDTYDTFMNLLPGKLRELTGGVLTFNIQDIYYDPKNPPAEPHIVQGFTWNIPAQGVHGENVNPDNTIQRGVVDNNPNAPTWSLLVENAQTIGLRMDLDGALGRYIINDLHIGEDWTELGRNMGRMLYILDVGSNP